MWCGGRAVWRKEGKVGSCGWLGADVRMDQRWAVGWVSLWVGGDCGRGGGGGAGGRLERGRARVSVSVRVVAVAVVVLVLVVWRCGGGGVVAVVWWWRRVGWVGRGGAWRAGGVGLCGKEGGGGV